jgi:hypothetical protein
LIIPPLRSTLILFQIYYYHNLINPLQCGTCFDIPLYCNVGGTKNPLNHLCTTYNIACSLHHWLHLNIIPNLSLLQLTLHTWQWNVLVTFHLTTTHHQLPWPHLDHSHYKFIIPQVHQISLWTSHYGMDIGNPIHFTLKLRFESILYKLIHEHLPMHSQNMNCQWVHNIVLPKIL